MELRPAGRCRNRFLKATHLCSTAISWQWTPRNCLARPSRRRRVLMVGWRQDTPALLPRRPTFNDIPAIYLARPVRSARPTGRARTPGSVPTLEILGRAPGGKNLDETGSMSRPGISRPATATCMTMAPASTMTCDRQSNSSWTPLPGRRLTGPPNGYSAHKIRMKVRNSAARSSEMVW